MMAYGIHPGGGCISSCLDFWLDKEGKNDHSRCPTSLHNQLEVKTKKRCLRCGTLNNSLNNFPTACSFHGHTTGEKGMFLLSPPHQGINGEWNDQCGVIVYRWNDKGNHPNTGRVNWNRRWSCCAEYGEDAPPCRRG